MMQLILELSMIINGSLTTLYKEVNRGLQHDKRNTRYHFYCFFIKNVMTTFTNNLWLHL